MRKYRGLTKDGKWVYGWYCKASNKHLIIREDAQLVDPTSGLVMRLYRPDYYINRYAEVIPETVGQQVGLKDKNIEAHKSDIIKGVHKTTKEEIVVEVVWDEKSFNWGVQMDVWIMGFECLVTCYDIEVIGNIHENPELMEKQ